MSKKWVNDVYYVAHGRYREQWYPQWAWILGTIGLLMGGGLLFIGLFVSSSKIPDIPYDYTLGIPYFVIGDLLILGEMVYTIVINAKEYRWVDKFVQYWEDNKEFPDWYAR